MATAPTSAANPIGIQDFLQILVAQLNYQDPLKPMDPQQFVSQLAQFTSLQQTQEINDKVASLLSGQGTLHSVGLLGKTVEVASASGNQSGQISVVSFNSGDPRLTVTLTGGALLTDVSISSLVTIR
ncbi:flagellar hook assembly protein FlgD [Aquabacterium sp.]|uniref:flagellar hook assembly protein FlgD n=1 Tax=Aquabacterium sp. TaxID=1872578 RepID=UPI002CDC67A8|nr:flagellar hook capping FlgD N-terminal domain-containing protein [Aquabacterium sp.]HSW06366.1 flagellar hook capping FlgD N-terminal domain-containing protein [Aquabacterium sp.]